jgi:hypothetical protein
MMSAPALAVCAKTKVGKQIRIAKYAGLSFHLNGNFSGF